MQTLIALGIIYALVIIACLSFAAMDWTFEHLLPRVPMKSLASLFGPLVVTMVGLAITIAWEVLSALLHAHAALLATVSIGIVFTALGAWFLLCLYTGNRPFILRK